MNIEKGTYYTENSDVVIKIHTIYYTSEYYMKVKASLMDKYNGQLLEHKTYKIYFKDIKHWKRLS